MVDNRDDERRETDEEHEMRDDDDELIDTELGDESDRTDDRTGDAQPESGLGGADSFTDDPDRADRDVGTGGTEAGIPGDEPATGMGDAGTTDTGMSDAGTTDTGMGDTGTTDTGMGAGSHHVTADDVGKDVLDSEGERIGIVSSVEGDRVHVDPDPGITDRIKAALGWGDVDEDESYAVEAEHIENVDDDAVRLRRI